MPEIERIWRISTDSGNKIEIRLSLGRQGDPHVSLEPSADQLTGAIDVNVARAVAQAMLEACEVASALSEQTIVIR
jgi:hypothetical protein